MSGHLDGVLPGHLDGVLPGHLDEVLPGHLDEVLPRHLDGVLPRHLDGVLPGHLWWMRFCLGVYIYGARGGSRIFRRWGLTVMRGHMAVARWCGSFCHVCLTFVYLCSICTFHSCQIFASLCIQGASNLDALQIGCFWLMFNDVRF